MNNPLKDEASRCDTCDRTPNFFLAAPVWLIVANVSESTLVRVVASLTAVCYAWADVLVAVARGRRIRVSRGLQ